jgi:hypothetical protein
MMMDISMMFVGEAFVRNGWLYRTTNQFNMADKTRYCERIAFQSDDNWHTCAAGGGDWLFTHCQVHLATLKVTW